MIKNRHSIFIFLFLGALLLCGFLAGYVHYVLRDLPDVEALKKYEPPQSTLVYDHNNQLVGRFYDERRTVISLSALPPHVVNAFIAAEDGNFFSHGGIDFSGLFRAVILEIKYRLVGGARVGGSTITQQTARTMLLSNQKTYARKIKEMVLARRIEQILSKEEILHLYLNQIYLGNGAYGIEEASLTYFSKKAKQLTIFEAAALAAIPKSPNRINPFSDLTRLRSRQQYVLQQMVKLGFISPDEEKYALEQPLFSQVGNYINEELGLHFLKTVKAELIPKLGEDTIRQGGLKVSTTLDLPMQRLAESALKNGLLRLDRQAGFRGPLYRPTSEELPAFLDELKAYKAKFFKDKNTEKYWDLSAFQNYKKNTSEILQRVKMVYHQDGLILGGVVQKVDEKNNAATVDLGSKTLSLPFSELSWARPYAVEKINKLPQKISEVLKAGDVISVKVRGENPKGSSITLWQNPLINGALVALDVESGAVLALVGGYDYNLSPFNRATQAKRQVGSAIKPFVYSKAINDGYATIASIITDSPRAFFDPGTDEYWRPRNHTGKYLGDITFRRCLRSSINTCTITLLEKVGIEPFLSLAKDVELVTSTTPYPKNLTIALGSAENTPLQVANALRIFPHHGVYSPYYMVDKVKLSTGQVSVAERFLGHEVLKPEAAFITSWILKDVISPEQWRQYLGSVKADLAGKTGTTNKARTTWFFGFSEKVLALVYVGYDDNRSMGDSAWGITLSFPIWADFMNRIPAHHEPLKFTEPANLDWRWVEQNSGKAVLNEPTLSATAADVRVRWEPFIAGTAPEPIAFEDIPRRGVESNDASAFAP